MPPALIPKTQVAVQMNHIGGPEVLEINEAAPIPTTGENELLVKNTFSGVNFIDTYFRSGLYPITSFPHTFGREAEGTVVAVGPGVTGFSVGDHVCYMGPSSQAEYTAVNPDTCVEVPSGIEPGVAAASLIQGLTALTMIRESHEVKPGDSVLVHAAAGGVGLWLCQVLRAAGAAKIVATASTEEKLELARKNGATHGINYSKEDWVERVKEITEGKGVIAVFDGVGKSTFDGDLEVLSRKGSLVSYGNSSGVVPPLVITRLVPKNVKVVRPQVYGYVATKEEFALYAGELLHLIEQKKVEVRIHKVYRLDEAQQAHKDIEGRGTTGKLLYKL